MTAFLVAVVLFGGLSVAAVALGHALAQHRAALREELSRRIDLGRAPELPVGPSPFLASSALLSRATGPRRLHGFGAAQVIAAIVGALIGVGVLGAPLGLLGASAGIVPSVLAWRRRVKDDALLVRQLPEALDGMTSALRAGHAFSVAMRLAAEECDAPLSVELARVVDEHDLGIGLRDAIGELVARRPDVLEVRLFASAVLFQQQAGGNLVNLLEQLAASIRDRIVFEEKARAITAEVRNATNVLGALPLVASALMLLAVPDHFDPLLASSTGRLVLTLAAVTLVVGVAAVHGLARSLEA